MNAKTPLLTLAALFLAPLLARADDNYAVKTTKQSAPKELSDAIRKVLPYDSIVFLDSKGKKIAELWLRQQIPVEADQLKSVNYRTLPEGTLFGAVRFSQKWSDYRKQKIKPGVYTLRLGYQPADGDHVGASKYTNFFLISKASMDKSAETLKSYDDLVDLSSLAVGTTHPGCFMLFPVSKPGDKPKVVKKMRDHWVVETKQQLTADNKSAPLGIGLTLVGNAGF